MRATPVFDPRRGLVDPGARQRDHRGIEAVRRKHAPWRGWYKLKAWLIAREAQLSREPFCARCARDGVVMPADVVNHRIPHKGDWSLFIDPANHESTCEHHHNSEIQSEEKREARRKAKKARF